MSGRHENGKTRADEGKNQIRQRRFGRVGRRLFVGCERETILEPRGNAPYRTFRSNDLARREKALAKQKEHDGNEKDVLYEVGGRMHQ